MQHDQRPLSRPFDPANSPAGWSRLALLALAGLAAGCGGGDDGLESFAVRTAPGAVQPASPLALGGRYAVYLVDEATTGAGGTDLNGNGLANNSVAHLVDLQGGKVTNLEIAARRAAVIGNSVYLAVDEAVDGVDWNGDTLLDARVLVRVPTAATDTPQYVDDLDPLAAPEFVVSSARLWYANTAAPALGNTTLQYLEAANPITPVPVPAAGGGAQLTARPLGEEVGVLFVGLDETADGVDLNGDTDQADPVVLALVLAGDSTPAVRNTGYALASAAAPVRARLISTTERLVGFLVDEASHGVSFNDTTLFNVGWLPAQCAGNDTDTSDQVLFYLRFSLWNADPLLNPPVNTGLAGQSRILLTNDRVATLAAEGSQGPGCDFNNDGDTGDVVLRWTALTVPVLPENSVPLNRAVQSVPGGAFGATELDGRFLAVLSESGNGLDLNGDGDQGDAILGWARPGSSTAWTVQHFDPAGPATFVGAAFLAKDAVNGRVGVGFLESAVAQNLNRGCNDVAKDNDTADTLPVWVRFNANNQLVVPGVGFALEPGNTGIVLTGGRIYFRVNEVADNTDYNNDSVLSVSILMRTPTSSCDPVAMSVLNSVAVPAITTADGALGAVFLCDEAQAGLDLNNDGDTSDFVLRYFRF